MFPISRTRARVRPILALSVFASAALWSSSAFALRPFNGTDAAVAEPNMFELELGAIRSRPGPDRFISPAFTLNYGIAENTELVFDGRIDRVPDESKFNPHRTGFEDAALSLKHVWHEGELQGKSGPSFATECGVLLPGVHADHGAGATCAGIVSKYVGPAVLHLNASYTHERDKANARYLGLIAEGPEDWTVRPVAEVGAARNSSRAHSQSKMLGAIWQVGKELAADIGVRRETGSEGKLSELRFGLTWGVHL